MLYQGETAIYEQSVTTVTSLTGKPERHSFTTVWCGFPVYAQNQSTVRAIEVVKELQKDGSLACHSADQLFGYVERIRKWVG